MIHFTKPYISEKEYEYIKAALDSKHLSGDGEFTAKCTVWFRNYLNRKHVLITTSCTHAIEMSALLCDINPGDQVIMPSFTFVSTANAFVLRGAEIVFIDIDPQTLNMDASLIESVCTEKTKAIVPVHYAGVACEMDLIMQVAAEKKLFVIEDAAQALGATYKGRALGTIGHFGAFSFHDTKNISSGEGGAIVINSEEYAERAEIIREKGTNRSKFFRGQVDKYTWVDVGSSYLPSELNSALLYAQLERMEEIQFKRKKLWNLYYEGLKDLSMTGKVELPHIPDHCEFNAHIFFIKTTNIETRTSLISYLRSKDIQASFHFIPLHTSPAGQKFGRFAGEDRYTTQESERLLRLPLHCGLSESDVSRVIDSIREFYA